MSVTAPPQGPLTAEEYARLPETGKRTELIRGQIVEIPMPPPKHGYLCANISREIGNYVRAHDHGRVASR